MRGPTQPAFDALFDQEYPRLVRALTVMSGDREAAADAVQDAFVQAHRHWRKVGQYADPAGWVRRAALNRLANSRRGDRRRARFVEETEGRGHEADACSAGASVDVDLVRAVRALPDGQRAVIALHYLADLSVAEVAAALGISTGTVKSQLHDGRAALALHPALTSEEAIDGA